MQNGAQAVYLGYGNFNARRNGKNFSSEEFAAAVSYCHLRGVNVYLTLNTLLTDRELPQAVQAAAFAAQQGIDAILVQDLGLATLLRNSLPDTPLHASTQMTICNLPGAEFCHSLGMTRVVLSRELSGEAIAYITKHASVETEVFAHGALCMCYSGQCFFSALFGGRSGNRGLCAQPCRLPYRFDDVNAGKNQHPLSLKDLSLSGYLHALDQMGVSCLKLEGRMKRPEYVAAVTGVYARALQEGREPTQEENALLAQVFSRDGFTQGYYTNTLTKNMFGSRREGTSPPEALYASLRESYTGRERVQIPLTFSVDILPEQPARLTLTDPRGNTVTVLGPTPEPARTKELTQEQLRSQLAKTGGSVFSCEEIHCTLAPGLSLPLSALNALRRDGLAQMETLRKTPPSQRVLPYPPMEKIKNRTDAPTISLSLFSITQLSQELLAQKPAFVWLPLADLAAHGETIGDYQAEYGVPFGAILPRIVWDRELPAVEAQLDLCQSLGVSDVLLGNWGLVPLCQKRSLRLHGDYGLGMYNSRSLSALKELGFQSATLSFELNLSQLRDLSKPLPTSLVAYGRLPLMLMEHGFDAGKGPRHLIDRKGESFPLLPHPGDRSELYNAKALYLADKKEELASLGLSQLRLLFTTESAARCAQVLGEYQDRNGTPPTDFTRGLYYRKVD